MGPSCAVIPKSDRLRIDLKNSERLDRISRVEEDIVAGVYGPDLIRSVEHDDISGRCRQIDLCTGIIGSNERALPANGSATYSLFGSCGTQSRYSEDEVQSHTPFLSQ